MMGWWQAIGRLEIPQCSHLPPYRRVLSFRWEAPTGTRSAGADASDWVPTRRLLRLLLPPKADRARSCVGRRMRGKLAAELGEQRNAVGDAKLRAGGGERGIFGSADGRLRYLCVS